MPIEVAFDDARRLVTMRISGSVSMQEVIATRTAQAAAGRWSYAYTVDSRASTRPPTTEELHVLRAAVAQLSLQHGQVGPVALIAPSDAGYGMGRMYEVFASPTRFAVFRELAHAERWLAEIGR